MNPSPELIPMLKQLRLSGILDSLELRNRQAIEEKFAYTDFLAMLIQDEVARRTQRKLTMAVRRANFRNHKTIEEFDFSFNPKINRGQVLDLATCRFMEEKACVLIAGPCGTGKSHLAQALGHCALRFDYNVLFISQTKMFGQLNAARATNSYDRRLAALAKIDLLIIDDFGLKPLRSPQDEDFHDLIAERYERKGTIITSNLDISEWGDAFPNKLLGAATIDRIRHGAYNVILDGKSFRSEKALPKISKSTIEKGEKNI
jgi:DNA replication protein DnaC